MSVVHHNILHNGRLIGHAVSLNTRYVFFSDEARLEGLDGRRFESIEAVRLAVRDTLAELELTPSSAA